MKKLDITTPENPILHQKTELVKKITPEIQTLIDDMILTMRAAKGVGLAAPQVNVPLRLAVIETPPETDEEGNDLEETRQLYVIINPEISWASQKKVKGVEGCLSIPGYVGEVERHQAIVVQGLDRRGKKLNLKLKGWTARIFQHEIDHLDGVMYTDRLTSPDKYWTEEQYEAMIKEQEAQEDAQQEAI